VVALDYLNALVRDALTVDVLLDGEEFARSCAKLASPGVDTVVEAADAEVFVPVA
jgi:hypothetical protein